MTCLGAMLAFSTAGFGQVTIPAANTDNGSVNDPFGAFYGYERSAMIYTAAEIGGTGSITDVGFYVNAVSAPANAVDVRIYMKQRTTLFTAASTYATETTGATLVYGPTTIPAASFVGGSWFTVTLTTPFSYTGGDNLEVIVETNYTGGGGEGSGTAKQFRYATQANNTYYQAWNADTNPPTGNGTRSTSRPNIQLTGITVPPCSFGPGSLSVPAYTSVSADLAWTAPSPAPSDGYEWEVRTSGAGGSGPTGRTTNGSTLAGVTTASTGNVLTANTAYNLYVRANCGIDGFSPWSGPQAFFTGYCTPTVTNAGDYVSSFSTTNGITNITNPSGAASPGNYGDFTAMSVSASENTTFNYSLAYVGGTNGIKVWVDWNNDLDFNDAGELVSTVGPGASPQSGTVTIPASTPLGNYRMRVRAAWNAVPTDACGNMGYGETEDYTLTVVAPPACPFATGVTVSDLAVNGATVSWTCTGCTGTYIIEYGAPGFTPGTDGTAGVGGTVVTSATTSVSLAPALTGYTNYQVYVRQECTPGSSYSTNSSVVNFYTGHCVPVGGGTSTTYYISEFSTTGGVTNISNASGDFAAGGYGDYTAQSVSQIAGGGVDFSITINGGSTYGINIWVDWNNDLDFADAGESVYTSGVYVSAAPHTGSFTVPPGTAVGNYRMRVREDYLSSNPTACGTSGYAEAEDYTLTVAPPPACMFPTGLTASAAGTTSISGSWTAEPTAVSGYNYEVRSSGAPGTPGADASGSVVGTTFTATGLTTGNTYQVYVQSNCDVDGLSTWVGPVSVTLAYCTPGPNASLDANGITNVTFANVDLDMNTEADGGYTDNSGVTGAIGGPGDLVPISVSVETGYTYDMRIWIDWNNDLDFADAGELVAGGGTNEADGTNPWVTSFTIPGAQAPGNYRMRIGGADSGITGPCFAGAWRAFTDFTVSVCLPPTDDGTAVVDNCVGQNYQVSVTVDLAGASSAMVEYSVNGVAQTPVAYSPGVLLGAFSVQAVVDVTVVTDQGCSVDLGRFHSACDVELVCGDPVVQSIHCYDSGDTRTWTWVNNEPGGTVSLKFLSGSTEATDNILFWEGVVGGTAATPASISGVLTGNLITSVGNTLSMSISTDGSGSCAEGTSGLTAGWVFQARCGGCVEPTGLVTADPNENGSPEVNCAALPEPTFNAYVGIIDNGIDGNTGLPPATVGYRLFVNNVAQPDVTGLPGGEYYLLGAFPLGTDLDVVLLHEDQAGQSACNTEVATNFTVGYNACPPANDHCANAEVLTLNPDGTCPANAIIGTTRGADQEGILPECQTSGTAQDAWYTFNSGVASSFTMTLTAGTAHNIGVQLFTACGTPAAGACLTNILPANNPITITVAPGTYYWLRVFTDVSLGTAGTFNICVSAFDPCTDVQNITACGVSTQATRPVGIGAWNAYGGPYGVPGKERLFTFTPSVTGYYTIQATAISGGYVDFYYKESSVGCNSTTWTYIDDMFSAGTTAAFSLNAGTEYYIMWDGESSSVAYDVTFQLVCPAPPPANDDCASATSLTVNSGVNCTAQTAGTIAGATDSGVAASCGNADDDVWYSFTATATSHTVALNNVSGFTDMAFTVYSNTCGSLTQLVCSDPNTTTLTGLSIGQTYLVQVYSYGTTVALTTTFDICVSTPPIPGSECSGAINIASFPVVNQALACSGAALPGLLNATNVTSGCGSMSTTYMGGEEALYTFTPTVTDDYVIAIAGVTYTSIGVYANACPTNGGICVGGVGSSTSSKSLVVSLTAGVQYFIWFDTWPAPNSPCPGTFSIFFAPDPPANDNCAAAVSLTVNPDYNCGSVTPGTVAFATASGNALGSCSGTPDDDVWFSFVATATAHRVSLLNITGSTSDMYMKFYRGANCGTMVDHACSDAETANLTGLSVGERVYVRVYTYTATAGQTSAFNICVGTAPPPPANDNCAGAVALSVNAGMSCTAQTAGTVQSATNSGIAVSPCVGTADDDVWYSFVATQTTHIVSLNSVAGSSTSMNFQVFSGACGGLTSVGCGATGTAPTTTLNSLAVGATYYVRVYTNTATGGQNTTFNICVTTPPAGPPANDNCAGAVALAVNAGPTCTAQTFGTVFNATGTLDAACAGGEDDDVWFSFVAMGPTHTISLNGVSGSVTSMNFQVLSGACGTLTSIACSSTGATANAVVTGLTEGNTYFVRVYTNTTTGGQNTTFNVCVTTPPVNDLCANAIAVGCNSVTAGTNVGATTIGAPATTCTTSQNTGPGVWYTVQGWGGTMVASLCGATFDTKIGVFTGSCGSLTCVTGNDDDTGTGGASVCGGGLQSSTSWTGTAGTTYYVYVSGYASTSVGTFNLSVTCGSTAVSCPANGLNLEFQNDANPGQVTWEVYSANGNQRVLNGADLIPANNIGTQALCLPNGCYRLRVLDSAGDGMTTGGYELRTSSGDRVIDNTNNFSTGSVSAISGNQTFCLPLGTDKPIFSSCDKLDWVNNKFIVVAANPAVSAQYGVSNANSGYEFWFYDPNGSYSFRRFRSHATSDGYGSGALRACHFKVNGWVNSGATPHLPANTLLNVRVRGRVAGSNLEFGPACQFKIDATLAACPRVKLQDDPANTSDYSCGVFRNFGGGGNANNRIYANPPQAVPAVASSNVRYQFRFRIPGEGICIVRPPQTSAQMTLNWTTGTLLECSKTYEVDVRVSLNGGATWCFGPATTDQAAACADTDDWGKVCNVTINPCGGGNGGASNMIVDGNSTFTMYPNPNRGDQFFVSLSNVEKGVNTVSVDIYDLTGKRVMARTIPVQDGFVNTNVELGSQLAGGLYMVNVTAGDKAYTERLVIQP